MARLLDRALAEVLLAECSETTANADKAKQLWDDALVVRGDAYLRANEGGLLVQEIAGQVGRSVGLVKLEIGKSKSRREAARAGAA